MDLSRLDAGTDLDAMEVRETRGPTAVGVSNGEKEEAQSMESANVVSSAGADTAALATAKRTSDFNAVNLPN